MEVAEQAKPQTGVSPKPALALEGVTYRLLSVLLMIVVWQVLSYLVSAKYVPGPWPTVTAVAKHAASGALAM